MSPGRWHNLLVRDAGFYERLGFAPIFTVRSYLVPQAGRDGAAAATGE